MKRNEPRTIQSVEKAMEIIDVILDHGSSMTLTEISEKTGYPKSTCHTIIATLVKYEMIQQEADGKYNLGFHLFECGCAISRAWDIERIAEPYLEKLSRNTDASASISVISNSSIIFLKQHSGGDGIQLMQTGTQSPLHATSQGKLFLSTLKERDAQRMIEETGMQAFTPHTITDPEQLMEELRKIRDLGYAVEDGEYKIGLRSVSAPVYDQHGEIKYALTIMGLFRRTNSSEFSNAISELLSESRQLSRAIGWRGERAHV